VDLSRVSWSAAALELHDEHRRTGTARARRALAAVLSLRARFTDDFMVAAAATTAAITLEPLEPLHRVRDALARLRFGDLDGALARLDALAAGVTDLPLVLVVKALATARRGEPRTARNIAERALELDPHHAGARFLHTEASLAAATKGGLDKLGGLPHGARYDAAWADLLAKLAIARPADHRAVTQQLDRGVTGKATRGDAVARTIAAWTRAPLDELVRAAEAQPAGSRGEELALALAVGKGGEPLAVVTALRALQQRAPGRPGVRRALVASITRLAIDEAAAERWSAALRAVQVCLELEPAEPTHHQNRAVLFTLAGEPDAALEAWAELDRVHYLSALLGRLDPASAHRYAAPHRMFAQAARLAGRTGIFLLEARDAGGQELVVHQELIDRDPEQLRHWLHHARAALTFELVSLGTSCERALLAPATPAIAGARAEGLCALVQSLAVLVPDEGRRLADHLTGQLRAAAAGIGMRYAVQDGDAEAVAVHRQAIELFAELALLCLRWEPDPGRRGVFDEVLDTVRAVAPLFDEHVFAGLLAERRDGPPDALRVLDSVMRVVLELHDREVRLDAAQRQRLAGFLTANLRISLIERRVVEADNALSRHEVEGLVEQLALARRDDPNSARLECWAAHLLMLGDFLDEAVEAIAAFHAIAKSEHPLAARIARIQEVIDDKRKHGRAAQRGPSGDPTQAGDRHDDRDLAAREAELEQQPSSVQLYGELCHELALADRWRDAHAWAGRALGHCLTPGGQLRARELALQLIGLEELGKLDRDAMAGFIAGARASALPALDRIAGASGSPGLEYVRGLSLLAADRRREAQDAFGRALARCTRGIFLPLLRPLAQDVETAVLEAAKQEVDAALAAGRFREAFSRIAERMTSVARPAPYLFELARTQLAALLPAIGTSEPPVAPPPIQVDTPWAGELAQAIQLGEAPARIRALCALATRVHEPSTRDAAGLVRKLDDLDEQLAVAAALDASIKLAAAGELANALAALAELGPRGAGNPRVLRHQAIVHLRLDQIAEADAAVERLAQLAEPIAREFAARYPALRFRQQIAAASTLVVGREFARARERFAAATPAAPDQHVELAYCRAYCAAAEGYRALGDGDRGAARRLVFEALGIVEARLGDARAIRHERLLELHTKLEADIALVEDRHA
jgi:tetratricopeptide (TPR) repeat protein